MQITFIVRLAVEMIGELSSKGYEIGNTDVTESDIEVLEFSKDSAKYRISISAEDGEHGEYLKVTGTMRKENWTTEDELLPFLKERRPGDHITVVPLDINRYFVKMKKNFNAGFDMEGIDKNALRAIALDILGIIVQ